METDTTHEHLPSPANAVNDKETDIDPSVNINTEVIKREETNHDNVRKIERNFENKECCEMSQMSTEQSNATKAAMETDDKEKGFQCDVCGKRFHYKKNFVKHLRKHTREKPYICDVCFKGYAHFLELQCHKIVAHLESFNTEPYHCNLCGKDFAHSKVLASHKRLHTGEKPYSCDECGKSFAQRSTLAFHKRSHTGKKS